LALQCVQLVVTWRLMKPASSKCTTSSRVCSPPVALRLRSCFHPIPIHPLCPTFLCSVHLSPEAYSHKCSNCMWTSARCFWCGFCIRNQTSFHMYRFVDEPSVMCPNGWFKSRIVNWIVVLIAWLVEAGRVWSVWFTPWSGKHFCQLASRDGLTGSVKLFHCIWTNFLCIPAWIMTGPIN
jgi:hypothetical protein